MKNNVLLNGDFYIIWQCPTYRGGQAGHPHTSPIQLPPALAGPGPGGPTAHLPGGHPPPSQVGFIHHFLKVLYSVNG